MSASRAEALQKKIDLLGERLTAMALKMVSIGKQITDLGMTITDLLIKGGQQAMVDNWQAERAKLQEQQATLTEQEATLEVQQAEAKAELAKLKAQQAAPPAARGSPKLGLCLYAVLDRGAPVGVAFFISPTRALTALHSLIPISTTAPLDDSAVLQLASSLEVILKRDDGSTLNVKVTRCDKAHDYALLESASPVEHFLTIGHMPGVFNREECFLLTWGVSLKQDLERGFTVHPAQVLHQSAHHIMYNADTFDGDCGGALLLMRNCIVLGVHQDTVNRVHERKRLRLEDKEDSVGRLIRNCVRGGVALRLDAFQFS